MRELDSAVVRSEPDVFLEADDDCVVHLWVCDLRLNGDPNGVVRVSKSQEASEFWRGAILPFNVVVQVQLDAGEVLVAKTSDEADLSFSVHLV